ncbi:MmgE/PrpD family protein [Advenella mimigardefordensis]|uniref:Putative 2-methylcitrate dehydratase PrpD n=1 Tax=Advenella mimigardefordensis (strain DSM 17166 / LMG 22922 / DPN7) TaxID=1247726 RepID=W0PB54_ADVMD|nr:MmgE/PrpD family protein [Advenella mimigardefordensis]AHG64099.1 putative 2-methylcitrate dehydratase PrpD [Advenella mimigardefordensis DPN7]
MDATIQKLARYIVDTAFDTIAPEAIHEARRRIIDSLGCAAAASAEPFCLSIKKLAARTHSTPSARIWGTGQETSIEMAAFANGTMLRYQDFSDTVLSRSNGHPSDMLGGLIAVAEAFHSDGKSLLAAVVVAYEIYCSLCASVQMAARGIDQGTAAAAGTAAGIASLLDYSEQQTANALCLVLAANLHLYNVRCGTLSDWKGCGGPNGARNGVFAAMLAREGVTGPTAPVEGKGGLWEILGRFEWDPGGGAVPLICQTHLKLHPVCYHGQSAVDAALILRNTVAASDVQRIEIETYEAAYLAMGQDPGRWAPDNRETADHSMPYTVAHAWITGSLSSTAYETDQLQSRAVLEMMKRISVSAVPELTAAFPANSSTRISVLNMAGSVYTHLQPNPKGNAGNPVSDTELEAKFSDLYRSWGAADSARQLLDFVWTIDKNTDVSTLVDALCIESTR